jgi:hypothetical protein
VRLPEDYAKGVGRRSTSRRDIMRSFGDQLRRHSAALISLSVALTALAYNTWRN